MKRRAIVFWVFSSILIVAVGRSWALHRESASTLEPDEVASEDGGSEPLAMARRADEPAPTALERPAGDRGSSSSTPHERQRDRLRKTATRIAMRREQAQVSGAPEPTVRALDAHLARIEQRLEQLDVTHAADVAETSDSPKTIHRSDQRSSTSGSHRAAPTP